MAIRAAHTSLEKIYCDKFDTGQVSSLSLFLFEDQYILFAKDQNGKVAAVHQLPYESQRELASLLKEDRLLRLEVPRRVFNYSKAFSLVPGIIFDGSLSSVYLFFAEKPREDDRVYQTSLESNTLHLVGAISQNLSELLQSQYQEISYHHGASCFLSYVLKEKFNLIDQEILVLLHNNFFFLAAFSKQELVLFNRFEAREKQEVLKYVMGILRQLNFSINHCRVSLYGSTDAFEINEAWGEQYFRNFKISLPHPNVQYLEGVDRFQHSSLFESFWHLQ